MPQQLKCMLCESSNIAIEYNGIIRDGSVNSKTREFVKMFKCNGCGVIWHNALKNYGSYYKSEAYRKELEATSEINNYFKLHDFECFDKFAYTGMEIFRDKIVADIGCGGGGFLDYISGVANKIIAIEPSEKYRADMKKRGYSTFAYAEDAFGQYENKLDTIVSFDVIEHVENPISFFQDIYHLLKKGGTAIVGTPTDAPVMRELLGNVYEENLLFSTQHIWIFNDKSLKLIAQKAGFLDLEITYKQRYGIGNMISWLIHKKAMGNQKYSFISNTMDEVWKKELEAKGLSDYLLITLKK